LSDNVSRDFNKDRGSYFVVYIFGIWFIMVVWVVRTCIQLSWKLYHGNYTR